MTWQCFSCVAIPYAQAYNIRHATAWHQNAGKARRFPLEEMHRKTKCPSKLCTTILYHACQLGYEQGFFSDAEKEDRDVAPWSSNFEVFCIYRKPFGHSLSQCHACASSTMSQEYHQQIPSFTRLTLLSFERTTELRVLLGR